MSEFTKHAFLTRCQDSPERQSDVMKFRAVGKYYATLHRKAPSLFASYSQARERVAFYKHKVTSKLDNYLLDFESHITASGAKVLYAEDIGSVHAEIDRIINRTDTVFVSDCEVVKECGVAQHFTSMQRKFEVIQPVTSHFPIQEIGIDDYLNKLSESVDPNSPRSDAYPATTRYRNQLHERMFSESVLISGASFLVCDPGAVVFCDNDGLLTGSSAHCLRHIVIAGIDQLVSSLGELDYLVSLLSVHSFGKTSPWSQQICFGPRRSGEADGPYELYVILVDNGRTKVLKNKDQREVLHCIGCQSCKAVCPVLRYINDFDSRCLTGPVDLLVKPLTEGYETQGFTPFCCTLCGKCTEVCPSDIHFQDLFLHARWLSVQATDQSSINRKTMKTLRKMLLRRKSLNHTYHRFLLKIAFKKQFGPSRVFPDFSQKSFHYLYTQKDNN